jgi:hypothetical protein
MPAKKNGRTSVQADFAALPETNQNACDWATRAVAYREVGKTKQTDDAAQKAKRRLTGGVHIQAAHTTAPPQLRKS